MEIKLKENGIRKLETLTKRGEVSTRVYKRARILLCLNQGKTETDVAEFLGIGRSTVWRTAQRCVDEGLDAALTEKERPGQPRKYSPDQEAEIIATACTTPPKGRKRWSIRLLTSEMKQKKGLETLNREVVRLILKKANLNLG